MSSLDPATFDDLLLKCLEGSATEAEQQAVIEAMETDEACWQRAQDRVGMDAGLKSLQHREKAGHFAAQLLRRITREEESRDFAHRAQERLRLEASTEARRGAQPYPAIQLSRTRMVIYGSAVAAVLLIVAGSTALWFSSGGREPPLTPQEQRQQEVIVEQLRELRLERAAVATSTPERAPETKAEPAPPDETARIAMQGDAAEAARFIEARQRFMMYQLRMFQGRRPLPEGLDVDEFESRTVPESGAPSIAETGPVEIGRVLQTEGEEAGVLIREAEKAPSRVALKKGQPLLSGDRIETARSGTATRASVRLNGGATLDLDGSTSVDVLGRDSLRLNAGRIYAQIAVPVPEESDPESAPPFSLQTDAGRFLTHDLHAEISLSSHTVLRKELEARIDAGKVHLVNRKGHAVGRKGQELRSMKDAAPAQQEGFSKPVWRGSERFFTNLPFGRSSPIIFSSYKADQHFGAHYAMAMALRGEINLVGLQAARGGPDQTGVFERLSEEARTLRISAPRQIPAVTLGMLQPLQAHPSGDVTKARGERSDAMLQILDQSRSARPTKPLVVFCHGCVSDVANAWLAKPEIADRVVIVLAVITGDTDWMWYENDPVAGEIAMRNFRCLIIRCSELEIDPARLQKIVDPRWFPLRNRNANGRQFYGLFYITNPDPDLALARSRFTGFNEKVRLAADAGGNIWEVRGQTPLRNALAEFDRIFLAPAPR